MNEELLEYVSDYYNYTEGDFFESLEKLKFDESMIVIRDQETGVKIAAVWHELLKDSPDKLLEFFESYDYEKDNTRMRYYPKKGFFSNGIGEFFIHYPELDMGECEFLEYKIEGIEIKIGRPSTMFRFLFTHLTYDKYFGEFDNFSTILINGATKENIESILQQAIMIFGQNNPSTFGDYPTIYEYYGYNDMWEDSVINEAQESQNHFSLASYIEAIHFYNEGKTNKNALDFYKVLEYFFIINKKDELRRLSEKLTSDGDIDYFTSEVTKIYKTDEFSLLYNLLENLNDIEGVTKETHRKGLIREDSLNEFTEKLYTFRNSIVHSKKDSKFDMVVPKYLSNESDEHWINIIEKLANLCIKKFCF